MSLSELEAFVEERLDRERLKAKPEHDVVGAQDTRAQLGAGLASICADSLRRGRTRRIPKGGVDEHINSVNVRKRRAVEDELFERRRGIRASGVVDGIRGGDHHPETHRLAREGIDARESLGDQGERLRIGETRG